MTRTSSQLFLSSPLTLVAAAFLLAALLAGCQSVATPTSPDLDRLQGHWQGTGPGGECSVTISGNSLYYTQPSSDPAKAEFWYKTTFTLPGGTDPKQLHATIIDNSAQDDIGTVVVTLFKIENGALTFGVVEDFEGPPPSSLVGDWDRVADVFRLQRANLGATRMSNHRRQAASDLPPP